MQAGHAHFHAQCAQWAPPLHIAVPCHPLTTHLLSLPAPWHPSSLAPTAAASPAPVYHPATSLPARLPCLAGCLASGPYLDSPELKNKFLVAYRAMTDAFLAFPVCVPGTAVWKGYQGRLFIIKVLC
ncbi:putative cytochrome P450 524A1, partial [Haematococcus lacustris]